MDEQKMIINGTEYVIPKDILERKMKHKHRKKDKWCNLYFFKNRTKTPVREEDVKDDLVITSALQYQRNTFYKMSAISAEDDTFDYFYKLKTTAPKNIVKKKSRFGVKKRNNSWKHYKKPLTDYEISSDGKFVVRFN
tara:strand:+ start:546 stop:956 length:411 start_codon:yes stop_codon:yes gene_type:complete